MSPRMELLEELSERRSRVRSLRHDESSGQPSCSHQRRVRAKVTVKPKFEILVVPATKTDHPAWLPLSNLDRIVNPTFVSVIFFYENALSDSNLGDGRKTFQGLTTSLKDSLAKVLVEFYPLAGRLTLTEEGLVDLQCNDAGAIFLESSIDCELSQLGGPQPMPTLSGMDIMNNFASVGSGLLYIPDQVNTQIPVLVINVTKFTCGSIAVAVNWHHTVADGFSGCHFIRSWAQIATGQELSLLPSHDRHLLKPRSPLDSSLVHNGNYGTLRKVEPIQQFPVQTRDPQAPLPYPVTVKPFILTKNTVQRLKEKVNSNIEIGCSNSINTNTNRNNGTKRPFTSTETVSAKLWKLITKARSSSPTAAAVADSNEDLAHGERSRFFMFVDGRKRLGLPEGYFGNVVCSACAESSRDDLLRRPLAYAASLISNAHRAINDEYFRSLIDWVEETGLTPSTKSCQSEHLNSTGFDVAATFWSFPLYEINFGWGKPVLSVRNAPPRKLIDGIAMMPGPDRKGNMVALLNLHADSMDKLQKDPEFIETAEPLHLENYGLGLKSLPV
ncbi:unnamed protein product [Calypogeia fissa]